jgi:3-methyladenine DNA glycosylase AlkD
MGFKARGAAAIRQQLQRLSRPEKKAFFPKFFRAHPGGYGEGDRFFGVVVPDNRKVARDNRDADLHSIAQLLDDPIHEVRLCALFILVDQMKRYPDQSRAIVDLYLSKLDRVNGWDLVDSSAPHILGPWLRDRDRGLLDQLAQSGQLWRQRVAIIATQHFIRNGEFADTLRIADLLLDHEHDLIQKAVGWMLREVGEKDEPLLESYLAPRYQKMPRTMLRYAIEKIPEPRRKAYLRGEI